MSETPFRIFISWSGSPSKEVARVTNDWLRFLFDRAEPWYSDKDIYPGTQTISEIHENLNRADAGVLLVTADNQKSPWINYEAGVLAQRVTSSLVIPILIDEESPTALTGPLGRLQNATLAKEHMLKVARALADPVGLEEVRLSAKFEMSWSEFEPKFIQASKQRVSPPGEKPARTDSDKIDELLQLVRGMRTTPPGTRSLDPVPQDEVDAIRTSKILKVIEPEMKTLLGDRAVLVSARRNNLVIAVPDYEPVAAKAFAKLALKQWGMATEIRSPTAGSEVVSSWWA